jgi:hypothetical protein
MDDYGLGGCELRKTGQIDRPTRKGFREALLEGCHERLQAG